MNSTVILHPFFLAWGPTPEGNEIEILLGPKSGKESHPIVTVILTLYLRDEAVIEFSIWQFKGGHHECMVQNPETSTEKSTIRSLAMA